MKRFYYLFLQTGLLPLLLFGCADQSPYNNGGDNTDDNQVSIQVTMQVPGGSLPGTYAMTKEFENAIDKIDVLVFKGKANGDTNADEDAETYLYHTEAPYVDVVGPGSNGEYYANFTITLTKTNRTG